MMELRVANHNSNPCLEDVRYIDATYVSANMVINVGKSVIGS